MSARKKGIPQEIEIENSLQEIKMIKCKILNIYELYFDPDDKEPIQPIEVQVNNEKETRYYFIIGVKTIEFIFGELIDNKLSNLEYDNNDIPISIKLPDIEPYNIIFNEYFFDLTFYQSDKSINSINSKLYKDSLNVFIKEFKIGIEKLFDMNTQEKEKKEIKKIE
ncbi:MAG: hypothetical protein ACFE9L_20320, partial [Candidatus Hodarchaeota archaeon]